MNLILFVLYSVLLFFGILNHEMWRDELEAWLVSINSSSLSDLLYNIKYEAHPPLWYIFLYTTGKFTKNPIAMQFLHLVIACSVIFVFLKWAPFNKIQKALFCFGYFPFYEFAVISRSYSLELLLIFIFCILFKAQNKNYILLSIILFLMSCTHVFGLFFAICFQLLLIFEYFIYKKQNSTNLFIGLFLFSLGLAYLANQLSLPEDSFYHINLNYDFSLSKLLRTLGIVYKGFIPIPNLTYNFCDTNILMFLNQDLELLISAILSCGLLIFSFLLFAKKPVPLFLYVIGNLIILTFTYLRFYGSLRQHGHLFILFIVCLWISTYYNEAASSKYKNIFIYFILCCQLLGGIYAYTLDLFNPFSESKNASRFIKEQNLQDLFIIGSLDTHVFPISAYLDRKIFYPGSGRYGTFVVWDKKVDAIVKPSVLFQVAVEAINQKNKNVLLILSNELIMHKDNNVLSLTLEWLNPNIKISKLREFKNSIRGDENYYIYLAEKK